MGRVIKYIFQDLLRTRFTILYTLFLFFSTIAMFQLDTDPGKVVMSLLNIILIVVPLVSVIFTTIHFYNSYEFIELMVAQPLQRRIVFLSEYAAVASSLCISFIAGVGIPMVAYGGNTTGFVLLFTGTVLTLVFVSFAFLASVLTRDKAKAIGVALLFWFYFSLIYDGLLLWIVYAFSDYPLEKVTLVMIAFNPVDLARLVMLLQMDISVLMSYTGAFFKSILGNNMGMMFSFVILLAWIVVPITVAERVFRRKDL
jgi:Cu-processing system permease protein